MYIAQTKRKTGLLIVDDKKRYFVANEDVKQLLEGKFTNKGGKPFIVLQPFESKEEQTELKK